MKKSQISIQFNWVFILIVGGIILLFFVGLGVKVKDVHQSSVDVSTKESFNTILAGVTNSPEEAAMIIELPRTEINFECQPNDGFSGYIIGSGQQAIGELPFFAPESVNSEFLTAWTVAWKVPYEVTNFLYITSRENRYIIIKDSSELYKELNKTLKSKRLNADDPRMFFNKEVVDDSSISSLENEGENKVHFVYFADPDCSPPQVPPDFDSMARNDLTALCINPSQEEDFMDYYGNLTFYEYYGGQFVKVGSHPYLGKASILGGIIAGSVQMYQCGMENAFERLSYISFVNQKRSEKMETQMYGDCATVFTTAARLYGFIHDRTADFNFENVQDIFEIGYEGYTGGGTYNGNNLLDTNYFSRGKSCGPIY